MQPLQFTPLLKRIRWGGRRLGSKLGKPIGGEHDYAESWELCDHGADQSLVAQGPLRGQSLQRLILEHPREIFGQHAALRQFPLLMKFLDANDRLSVQVHPNDEQARVYDPRENGKTEAWVIIDAEPGSRIFAGLADGVDRTTLERALKAGDVEQCLQSLDVAAGDCVFIPAGTVHAIGEGVLLAEVQQSSDLTFRLYDWGRVGTDGKPRELHLEQALACIDFDREPVRKATPTLVANGTGRVEEVVRCPYFVIRRHLTSQPFALPADDRCHILTVLRGSLDLFAGDASLPLRLGETVLLPATALPARLVPAGDVTLLETFLP